MRHKRFFIVITLIAIVGGVSARHHKKAVNKIEKAPVHLNEILTNELSDISSLEGMDQNIESFMREWSIKGASLSIMRNDSLIYAKGYGIADEGEPMKPSTLLRVASVSKLVTATAIMVLKERGLLSLNEKVFAEGGILDEYIPYIKDKRYFDITIKHLLTHQAGFTTRGGDPMFETLSLMKVHKWENLPDSETIIKTQLRRRLGFAPGKGNSYSNFGYLLLSEIIELITGQDYETWTRNNVLIPAGCYDMYLGYTFYKDKLPGESRYFVHSSQNDVECCDGSGELVERCYGGSDFRGLKGAGAWVTSTPELARFVASIDGRDEVPDIISKESVKEMTFTTDEKTYPLGWSDVSSDGTWTRTGTLASTSALIKYYPDGECWILVTNTGTWKGPKFTKWTSSKFRKLREKYSAKLPERDFFS